MKTQASTGQKNDKPAPSENDVKENTSSQESDQLPRDRPKLKTQVTNSSITSGRRDSAPCTIVDPAGGHAITKSFRKFTFTKDGKCIEETGKIFQNDPDGKWTTIKTTTVKTNSNAGHDATDFNSACGANDDEKEQPFDHPKVERSDSTSSSGPDDIFEDFFDSFTGDTMFFNLKRMNSLVKKHFGNHHPLFQKHRQFDSSFRKMGGSRRRSSSQTRSSRTDTQSQNEDADNDFDVDSPFSAIGSQNIQKLLKNFNRDSVDDFLENRFSTIGRPRRRTSRFSGCDSTDPDRDSLLDSFLSSGRRPSSAFGRSMSNERQRNAGSSRSSFDDSSSQYSAKAPRSEYVKAKYGQQQQPHYSSNPNYSRQSSQCSNEPLQGQNSESFYGNVGRQSSDFSSVPEYMCQAPQHAGPEYSRSSSHYSVAPGYSRQSSQFSTEPEYGSGQRQSPSSSEYTQGPQHSDSNPSAYNRQSSQFSTGPSGTRRTYSFSTDPTEVTKHHPNVITHRITRSNVDNRGDGSPAASECSQPNVHGEECVVRKPSISSTAYSRQSSTASENAKPDPFPDGGFRATIKLSRSGFEPPDIQHSVFGTIRPQIRIRYTRSESAGVPRTTYTAQDGYDPAKVSSSGADLLSKCEDGIHCGTPERDVTEGKCTDGKHCGTPPPDNNRTALTSLDSRYSSPSIYATMKPRDIRKYIHSKNSDTKDILNKWHPQGDGSETCDFDARPHEVEAQVQADNSDEKKQQADESDLLNVERNGRNKSRSPSENGENDDAKSETSTNSTMSLLESLKTLGYADVMKSRQSQKDLNAAKVIADVRAKRLAGENVTASSERLNMLSSRQNSESSDSVTSGLSSTRYVPSPDKRVSNRAKSEEVVIPKKDKNEDNKSSFTLDQAGISQLIRCGSEEPQRNARSCRESETSEAPNMKDADEKLRDSVSERIRRKSYFTRFNDDRPRRNKKTVLVDKPSRRHSGYLSSYDEDTGPLSGRRTSYSHSHSRDSCFEQPGFSIGASPSSDKFSLNGSFDSPPKGIFRNNDEWFQDAEARASKMLNDMYEHDARMLQSLPVHHRSSRKSGFSSDSEKKSRRPRHYDDFQPSSGYLSNLHKPNGQCEAEQKPSKTTKVGSCNGNDKFDSLMDSFDQPKDVLRKAMNLLNC